MNKNIVNIAPINLSNYYLTCKSIAEFSDNKIVKFDTFNPCISLFINSSLEKYCLDVKYPLDRQISEDEGLINKKIKPIYTKKISFIGEDFDKLHLFYDKPDFGQHNYDKHMMLYDVNSGANIEVFISYLVSRLNELKLCPSYNYFYFSTFCTVKRYTYDISSESLSIPTMKLISKMVKQGISEYDIVDYEDGINEDGLNEDGLNEDGITESSESMNSSSTEDKPWYYIEDNIKLTMYNHPVIFLITEKNDRRFIKAIINDEIDLVTSVIFQVFAASIISYRTFGIKNNDLHTDNIMLKKTKKTHIFYKLADKYYVVPTYGYIAKIIDWGRGTYFYEGIRGYNTIYNSELYEDFYNYSGIKNKKVVRLPDSEECKHSDIAIFCHSIINDLYLNDKFTGDKISDSYSTIYNFTKQFCIGTNIKEYNWNTYEAIMKKSHNYELSSLFNDKFFNEYLYGKKKPKTSGHIYAIY